VPDLVVLQAQRRLRGCAYGVPQATLLVACTLRAVGDAHVQRIEEGLAELIDVPLPPRARETSAGQRVAGLCAFAIAAIQRQSRLPVAEQARAFEPADGGGRRFLLAVAGDDDRALDAAIAWVQRVVNELAASQPVTEDAEVIHARLHPHAPVGQNTYNIVTAALKMGVPVRRIGPRLVLLGTGRHTRAMDSSLTDRTPAIGVRVARSKFETATMLRNAGLPGALHKLADSAEAAVRIAEEIGYPVVVKPDDQEQGRGVAADLRDARAVASAYDAARLASRRVLVERWSPGTTHRLTVFQGEVVRIARRIAGGVYGDGQHTVAQLVDAAQDHEFYRLSLRRRGRAVLQLDDEARSLLAQQGRDDSWVPPPGEYVRLRRRDNVNAGGRNEAVAIADAHPDNLQLAIDAAALLYLDFAGIDLIIPDITLSWQAGPALICEVNAQPQLGARGDPAVYDRLLGTLLGPEPFVPSELVIVAGEAEAKAELARALGRSRAGGVCSRDGCWVDGRKVTAAFADGFLAALALLQRRDVNSALCIMTVAEVVRAGLPADRWDRITTGRDQAARLGAMIRDHVRRQPRPAKEAA
jgi:cyanophycin synthetase